MSETPYTTDENNKLIIPREEGLLPLFGLFPVAGGIGVKMVGNTLTMLEAIASDLKLLKESLENNPGAATVPRITQIPLVLKNTQYTFQFPQGTKKYSIRNRDFIGETTTDNLGTIRYAYQPGLVATPIFDGVNSFGVLNPKDVLIEEGLNLQQDMNIYFATDTDDVPLTIEYWV